VWRDEQVWVKSLKEAWRVLKHPSTQEYTQECSPGFVGGSRNRGYGGRPFGIHSKKSEPGADTVVMSLIAPYTQATREVQPLQGEMALSTFKKNTIRKYHQQLSS